MSKRYEKWLDDPWAKQVLETFGVDKLQTPQQQEALEALVDNVDLDMPTKAYRRYIRLITEFTVKRSRAVALFEELRDATIRREEWTTKPESEPTTSEIVRKF